MQNDAIRFSICDLRTGQNRIEIEIETETEAIQTFPQAYRVNHSPQIFEYICRV